MMKRKKNVEVGKSESTVSAAALSESAAAPGSRSPEPSAAREHRPARAAAGALIAKKDFLIRHNGYERVIKTGDDLKDVPALYHPNLRTEGVL
jgi:hypothetical protein